MSENLCYICRDEHADAALDTHHLIPKYLGGRDTEENTVQLCANCHRYIEDLYGSEFYTRLLDRLGVDSPLDERPGATAGRRLPDGLRWVGDSIVPDHNNGFEKRLEALELRKEGCTLRETAEETGIPRSTISDLEDHRQMFLRVADRVDA